MQYSLAKLIAATTIAAVLFGAVRSIHVVGPLCLPVGLLLLFCSGIAYPFAILLGSPQKGTQLDLSTNPVLPYVHLLAAIGAALVILFVVYVASNPIGFLFISPL